MSIPIIDISPIFGNDQNKINELVNLVDKTMQEVGFFMIKNHQFKTNVLDKTWKLTRKYFDQSFEIKNKIPMTPDYPYGYESKEILSLSFNQDKVTHPDMKETFQICINSKNNKLPQTPNQMASAVTNYYLSMSQLAEKLLEIFALALKEPRNWFKNKIDNHQSALRLLNYPHVENYIPGRTRATQHSDYGILTILKQDNVGGLQVLSKEEKWIDVKSPDECFVINIGDLMKRWTNDKWKSTIHRVVNPNIQKGVNNRRQSIAFFFNANPNTIVQTFESCKNNGISKYTDVIAGEYLMIKHTKAMKAINDKLS